MAKENETIADIIAEKRRRADEIERDCAEKMKRGEMVSDCYARELVADIRREADRLDAAHRREKAAIEADALAVGGIVEATREAEREAHERESDEMKKQTDNAAKLRDACAEAAEIMERVRRKDRLAFNIANYIEGVARTALAAPARNCDKYANHNDAMKAFEAFVRERGKLGFINPYTEAFKWLFAPTTEQEGGKDGNE
jgi:hypothetical protein